VRANDPEGRTHTLKTTGRGDIRKRGGIKAVIRKKSLLQRAGKEEKEKIGGVGAADVASSKKIPHRCLTKRTWVLNPVKSKNADCSQHHVQRGERVAEARTMETKGGNSTKTRMRSPAKRKSP